MTPSLCEILAEVALDLLSFTPRLTYRPTIRIPLSSEMLASLLE